MRCTRGLFLTVDPKSFWGHFWDFRVSFGNRALWADQRVRNLMLNAKPGPFKPVCVFGQSTPNHVKALHFS
jgi:hypothetical protein